MDKNIFLENKTAKKLYKGIKDLPIIDYHCHLSPQEIYEDKPFTSIYEMWLKYDHYKWRLLRAARFDESYITGNRSEYEKFEAYITALSESPNHPLYHWSMMELSEVFGIDLPLRKSNAKAIYDGANAFIIKEKLSPRKLFLKFRVEALCTTDDPADSLLWHEKIAGDKTLSTKVLPSFRTDNVLRLHLPGYPSYIEKLGSAANIKITDLTSLQDALSLRLKDFVKTGCVMTDMGIPEFPDRVGTREGADTIFGKALRGEKISREETMSFIGYMTVWFGNLYKELNLVQQFHLGVTRDANSVLLTALGNNIGCDTANDVVPAESLIRILDAENKSAGLPRTILYTLNESDTEKMASIAYAFPSVTMGAAWWFDDHYSGIRNAVTLISELGTLGSFPGMLTDSRSFLSYARHDYYRRIIATMVGEWVEKKTYDSLSAEDIVRKLSYDNTKKYFI